MDFSAINRELLARAKHLLPSWLPGGQFKGSEFVVGGLHGEKGKSLSVNVETGIWADFAVPDHKGGDLIALYAALHNLQQAQAARELSDQYLNGGAHDRSPMPRSVDAIVPVPADAGQPPDNGMGAPTAVYPYQNAAGHLIGYIRRYDTAEGKTFRPAIYTPSGWVAKAIPKPRPMYRLQELLRRPGAQVIVTEGEKACEAARQLLPKLVCVTWAGGSNAVLDTDWSPLKDRDVLLWPDADTPGLTAMMTLGGKLTKLPCKRVQIVKIDGQEPGFDAADLTDPNPMQWLRDRKQPFTPTDHGEVASTADHPVAIAVPELQLPAKLSEVQTWQALGLEMSAKQVPWINLSNVTAIIEKHPELRAHLWFDQFHNKIFANWGDGTQKEWADHDDISLTIWMQKNLWLPKMTDFIVSKSVLVAARKDIRHEVRQWLKSLVWDGEQRVSELLTKGFGSQDDAYHRAAGRCFMTGMVARVMEPGCKMDNMIVFEGPQGIYKSTALEIIGGKWFCECHEQIGTKDFYQTITGKWLVEISELHSFRRAEVERVKAAITCRTDRYRASYGRHAADHPRQCVFAGTTNQVEWLADETGGRRFWPVACRRIDPVWIREHRDQLFAEALHLFESGRKWWDVPVSEANEQQLKRRIVDPWYDTIAIWTESRTEFLMDTLFDQCLEIRKSERDRSKQLRIGSILRELGWKSRQTFDRGANVRLWIKREVEEVETPFDSE